jgi:hypothetical protein
VQDRPTAPREDLRTDFYNGVGETASPQRAIRQSNEKPKFKTKDKQMSTEITTEEDLKANEESLIAAATDADPLHKAWIHEVIRIVRSRTIAVAPRKAINTCVEC